MIPLFIKNMICFFFFNMKIGCYLSIASGLRIFRAYIPTALPMDYEDATEAVNIAPFTRHPQIPARIPALDSSDSVSDAQQPIFVIKINALRTEI